MNSDPVYQRLREAAWQRRLTPTEQAELQAWLAAHPEVQPDVELEAVLDLALEQKPAPRVSSNFTARVMQTIAADAIETRSPTPAAWWQRLLPRLAFAAVLIMSGALGFRHYQQLAQQEELTRAAQQLATAQALSNPEVIADFDVIRNLSPTTAAADEGLLALSDELLALGQ